MEVFDWDGIKRLEDVASKHRHPTGIELYIATREMIKTIFLATSISGVPLVLLDIEREKSKHKKSAIFCVVL